MNSILQRLSLLKWFYCAAHKKELLFSHEIPAEVFFDQKVTFHELLNSNDFREKLSRLKSGLDTDSCANIDRLLINWLFLEEAKHRKTCFQVVNDGMYERFHKQAEAEYIKYSAFEHFKPFGPDSLLFHHGLFFAPEKVKKYIQNKIFVDGGAYVGDSAVVLQKYCPGKVLSFEISQKNIDKYLQTMKTAGISENAYEIIKAGLGDKSETVFFEDRHNAGTSLMHEGKDKSNIIALDSMINEIKAPIGFVKLDVEGYGLRAIKGMTKLIKRDHPVISVAIYHNREEFFEIKPYLESLNIPYHFQVFHLSWNWAWETNLFAYPEK